MSRTSSISFARRSKLEGHTVITASTGRGAIAMARLEAPDLALLDVSMPEGDGFAVAAAFTDSGSGMPCPVIFLTARAERRYELLGYAHGAVDYIQKPFEPDAPIRRVNNALQSAKRSSMSAPNRPRISS